MPVVIVTLLYLLSATLFWLPGQLVAAGLLHRGLIAERDKVPVGIVTSLLIGYGAFIAYWISTRAGTCYSVIVLILALTALAGITWRCYRTRSLLAFFDAGQSWWAGLMFPIGLIALALLFLHGTAEPELLAGRIFFESDRPGDNVIPLEFAKALVRHDASLHGLIGDWTFADRPPLEAGIIAMLWPLRGLGSTGLLYQCAGTMLQTLWVPTFTCLADRLGYGRAKTTYAILVTAVGGLVYFESVYLWPKLLAGAIFLIVLLPLVSAWRERRRIRPDETALMAAGTLCAVLAHGAIGFSVVALAILLVPVAFRLFQWSSLVAAVAIFIVGYAPWLQFQSESTQAGNRLAKIHLAGTDVIDKRGAGETIIDAYRRLTFDRWLSARRANLTVQIGSLAFRETLTESVAAWFDRRPNHATTGEPIAGLDRQALDASWGAVANLLRVAQREYLVPALDVIWFGWLALPWLALSDVWRRRNGALLALAGFSLWSFVVWSILEFSAGSALLTHASFGLVLCIELIGAVAIYDLGRIVRVFAFGFHTAIFFALWILMVPGPNAARQYLLLGGVDPRFASLGIVALAVLCGQWWRIAIQDSPIGLVPQIFLRLSDETGKHAALTHRP
jgi:hypothetical protein